MVQVAVAVFTEPAKVGLDVVHAIAPAVPETLKVTVPVGVLPPEPVTVAVKTMLPPNDVGLLLVTTFVGTVVAPAMLVRPIVNPDATRTPSARCRITARRMPMREYLVLLIDAPWGICCGGSHGKINSPYGSLKTLRTRQPNR
jgi:hypothetical protein